MRRWGAPGQDQCRRERVLWGEEGVVLPPHLLFDQGRPCYEAIGKLLAGTAWPSRAIDDNLADLQAQAAANLRGAASLAALAQSGGTERLRLVFQAPEADERGGGAIREIVFLEKMSVSLLTQHQVEGPYGMKGGGRGAPGKQILTRAGEGQLNCLPWPRSR